MLKKIQYLSSKAVIYLGGLFLTIIVLMNVVSIFANRSNDSKIFFSEVIILLGCVIILVVMGWFLFNVKKERTFLFSLFFVGLIIRIIWISTIQTEPVSDFGIMYEAAQNIKIGNYNEVYNSNYFSIWAYQLGFTFSMAVFMKIISGGLFHLKIINSIIISLIPVVIYITGKKLGNNNVSKVIAIIYCFYVTSIASTAVLTNQHLATLLFYLGLYLIVSSFNKNYTWILVGILFGIGNIIRPEGAVVIIALFLYLLFGNLNSIIKLRTVLLKFIGIIIIIFTLNQVLSMLLINAGISKYKLSNRDPLWKITCGINPDTKGTYSEEDDARLSTFKDRQEGHITIIKERLSDTKQLIKTIIYKVAIMWGSYDTSIKFAFTDNIIGLESLYKILIILEKIQYIIIVLLAMGGIININKIKDNFINSNIFTIIFIGYFLAHIIIEIQPRYRYFVIPSLCIIATYVKFNILQNQLS